MLKVSGMLAICLVFFFQAEDGIRYLVRSRGLGDVYKRQRPRSDEAVRQEARRAGEVPPWNGDPRSHRSAEHRLSLIHI